LSGFCPSVPYVCLSFLSISEEGGRSEEGGKREEGVKRKGRKREGRKIEGRGWKRKGKRGITGRKTGFIIIY
jgi:hypothetical protein